jgi:hypothetical protein
MCQAMCQGASRVVLAEILVFSTKSQGLEDARNDVAE